MTEPLPSLSQILSSPATADSPLAHTLGILLESSTVLLNTLVPQLASRLALPPPPVHYTQLIDRAFDVIRGWDDTQRAHFIHGHPRIGEVNNLSRMSAQEQAGESNKAKAVPTSPDVLRRLAFLNRCYERRYPGLVYITFVNGRSRAQIRDEMEEKLSAEGVLPVDEGEQGISGIEPRGVTDNEWQKELGRAVEDVARIAKSRLEKLGVE